MHTMTKMKIEKPASELFEAFTDPAKIGGFWFSSSSERWAQGKSILLRYDEYDAEGTINIRQLVADRLIVFEDDNGHTVTITFEDAGPSSTIIAVKEEGFREKDDRFLDELLDNKEGWTYTLACLKAFLEYGANLRAALVK
ncbi:SRPBCC family protein [Planococcus sp. FY231025]|uniref:SRPBCC family protein n=1 Tax=Planococcus sp. FY231025 TaxID=3455699 RepID=UPI003F92D22F